MCKNHSFYRIYKMLIFFLPIGRMPRLAFSGTVCIMLVFSLGSQSRREQMRYFSPSEKRFYNECWGQAMMPEPNIYYNAYFFRRGASHRKRYALIAA